MNSYSVEEEAEFRGVHAVLHFTRLNGAIGILATGYVLSREQLPNEKRLEFIGELNATNQVREIDRRWHGYVNMSVSKVNEKFFRYSRNTHPEDSWVVFVFSPQVLSAEGVIFCTTNNVYPSCLRQRGVAGFSALFADRVLGRYQYEHYRDATTPSEMPTDVQAEVLVPERVSVDHLIRIAVENDAALADVDGILGGLDLDIPVVVDASIFR